MLEFTLISLALIVVPGPNVLFAVSRSLQHGRIAGLAEMLMLGAIFTGMALVSDSTWALIAGTARDWFARSPRRLEIVGGAGGLVMIGIGASLALTGRTG